LLYFMAPYSYLPLNEKRKEIRVLTLFSRTFSEDIRITLENKILSANDPIKFEALSYVWGSANNPAELKVGSHTLAMPRCR
jgi:hypothetical protein